MSEQAKLPEGMVDAFARRLIQDDSNEIICLGRDSLREALGDYLAQRDAEWREGLEGLLADVPDVRSNYHDGYRSALRAALDKAAPDGGGGS